MSDAFDEFASLIGRALAKRWLKELDASRSGADSRRRKKRRRKAAKPKEPSQRRPANKGSKGEQGSSAGH